MSYYQRNITSVVINKFCFKRPAKGSLSEMRAFKATIQVCREMMELCDIIDQFGENLFTPEEKADDPRKVISFGELFSVITKKNLNFSNITHLVYFTDLHSNF